MAHEIGSGAEVADRSELAVRVDLLAELDSAVERFLAAAANVSDDVPVHGSWVARDVVGHPRSGMRVSPATSTTWCRHADRRPFEAASPNLTSEAWQRREPCRLTHWSSASEPPTQLSAPRSCRPRSA